MVDRVGRSPRVDQRLEHGLVGLGGQSHRGSVQVLSAAEGSRSREAEWLPLSQHPLPDVCS